MAKLTCYWAYRVNCFSSSRRQENFEVQTSSESTQMINHSKPSMRKTKKPQYSLRSQGLRTCPVLDDWQQWSVYWISCKWRSRLHLLVSVLRHVISKRNKTRYFVRKKVPVKHCPLLKFHILSVPLWPPVIRRRRPASNDMAVIFDPCDKYTQYRKSKQSLVSNIGTQTSGHTYSIKPNLNHRKSHVGQ